MEAKEEMKNKKKLTKTENTHVGAGLVSAQKRNYTNCFGNNNHYITNSSRHHY